MPTAAPGRLQPQAESEAMSMPLREAQLPGTPDGHHFTPSPRYIPVFWRRKFAPNKGCTLQRSTAELVSGSKAG